MPTIYQSLEADHRHMEDLLGRLEAPRGQAGFDHVGRRRLRDHLVVAGSRHEVCEELVLWPAVRKRAAGGEALRAHALAQERDAKHLLDALRFATSEEEIIDLSRQVGEVMRLHVAFEEAQVWPALRSATTRIGARMLGAKLSLAAKVAPTRPHPRGPDSFAGLLMVGTPAAALDRLRDRLARRRGSYPGRSSTAGWPDAVAAVERDHASIESLLAQLDPAGWGADLEAGGRTAPDPGLVNRLIREVSVHDWVEREHLYPLARRRIHDGNDLYAHWIAEHGAMVEILSEIDRRPEGDPHRRRLLDRLIPLLRTHIAEEESGVLPALRARMADEELTELGRTLQAAKAKAPTRPHGRAAGVGVGARLSRVVIRPLDRVRDAASGRDRPRG